MEKISIAINAGNNNSIHQNRERKKITTTKTQSIQIFKRYWRHNHLLYTEQSIQNVRYVMADATANLDNVFAYRRNERNVMLAQFVDRTDHTNFILFVFFCCW